MDLSLNRTQQAGLVVLRTLIGWHFLYEGDVKTLGPAWSRDGSPLAPFASAGYLRSASGPFSDVFRRLADVSWLPWLDQLMAWSLLLVGLGRHRNEEGAPEGAARETGVTVASKAGPAGSASESRARDAAGSGKGVGAAAGGIDRLVSYRLQVSGFCSAVRTGSELKCGPQRARSAARACIAGFDAIQTKTRVQITA